MKKGIILLLIMLVLICFFGCIEYGIYKIVMYKNNSERTLKLAYELIQNENQEDNKNLREETVYTDLKENEINQEILSDKKKIICQNEIIGVLIIPKLNVEAPIQDGTTQNIMNISIGHFKESDYWNGNVSLASHNSGISAHYFEDINKLNIGDEINYITKIGKKVYEVKSIDKIKDTDWSSVVSVDKQTENNLDNTITLITCINGLPNYRLCVRGIEIDR